MFLKKIVFDFFMILEQSQKRKPHKKVKLARLLGAILLVCGLSIWADMLILTGLGAP